MAYVTPTAAEFRASYPGMAAVADTPTMDALAAGERNTNASWPDADRRDAVMLYAAHRLTLNGLGGSPEAQLAGFSRIKISSLELEAAPQRGDASRPIMQTGYGRQFAALARRLNGPAFLVV